jgi:hypothetical protein
MNWHRIQAIWKQLNKSVWEQFRTDRNGVDLIGPAASRESQSSDKQTTAPRIDDQVRRSEFSLHIGS